MSQRKIKIKAPFQTRWLTDEQLKKLYANGQMDKFKIIDAKAKLINGIPSQLTLVRLRRSDEL